MYRPNSMELFKYLQISQPLISFACGLCVNVCVFAYTKHLFCFHSSVFFLHTSLAQFVCVVSWIFWSGKVQQADPLVLNIVYGSKQMEVLVRNSLAWKESQDQTSLAGLNLQFLNFSSLMGETPKYDDHLVRGRQSLNINININKT